MSAFQINLHRFIFLQLSFQYCTTQRIQQVTLYGSLDRTGTKLRIKTSLRKITYRSIAYLYSGTTLYHVLVDLCYLQPDNFLNLFLMQRFEDDNLIYTVQELRSEMSFQHI